MSAAVAVPLTWSVAAESWTFDVFSSALIAVAGGCYARWHRRGGGPRSQAYCFAAGLAVWFLAGASVIAVYSPVLFWMRALQTLLLLFVAPFLLALGAPVQTWRAAASESGRVVIDRVLAARWLRYASSPLATSIAMLGVPWLLYLTPWYVASMTGPVAALTRVLLVAVGAGYFYARLQCDLVPRRFSPLLSIAISVVESLGDGLLGLVLWLGPLVAYQYYAGLQRNWGPSMRTDQSVGAGILWILGDVLGLPFLLMLMRSLGRHAHAVADEVDTELDHADPATAAPTGAAQSGALWWDADPQLRERFGRRG